jgi:hypothetical protein
MSILETDPLDIALGADGDIALGADGGPYLTSGLAGVAQLCRTALLLFRGEWFRDLDAGVAWMANDVVPEVRAILGQRLDEAAVRAAVRGAVLAVPGVLALTRLEVALDARTRRLTITWAARTVFGDTPVDVVTPGVP